MREIEIKTRYWQDGTIRSRFDMLNGKIEGKLTFWRSDGSLQNQYVIINGLINGIQEWWMKGRTDIMQHKNNLYHGPIIEFKYEN